jgi:hypothetical protein
MPVMIPPMMMTGVNMDRKACRNAVTTFPIVNGSPGGRFIRLA